MLLGELFTSNREMHHVLYDKSEICENWLGTVGIMNSHLYP